MEIEYKWDMPGETTLDALLEAPALVARVEDAGEIRMRATYFDTDQLDVQNMHGGLRIRQENEQSVCCLKLAASSDGACKARQEFEVEAFDIVEGLEKLPDAGAPADVCALLVAHGPRPSCETDFTRLTRMVAGDGFTAELAIDTGEMRRDGRTAPICELELEYLTGDEEAFHAFARGLQEAYDLVPQPLSKLARAMSL